MTTKANRSTLTRTEEGGLQSDAGGDWGGDNWGGGFDDFGGGGDFFDF